MKFNQLNQYRFTSNRHIEVGHRERDVWIIGDVHGCAREFGELCHRIRLLNQNAIIVQLGDLIDRGPYLKEVFDVVDEYGVICTIGNHELNFILEHQQYKRCGSKARQENHTRFLMHSSIVQNHILKSMQQMHNSITVDVDHGIERWCLSHAPVRGYEAAWPERGITAKNAWTFCARNEPYDESYFHPQDFAAHGHQHWNYTDIDKQINDVLHHGRQTLNVDGGCVYGGELVAVNLNKLQSIRIEAYETYFDE